MIRTPRTPGDGSERDPGALRIFRRLLRLMPAEFRAAHGQEMEAVFAQQLAAIRGREGRWAAYRFALRGWLDLVRAATAVHNRRRPVLPSLRRRSVLNADVGRGRAMLIDVVADLRQALRMLTKAPGSSVVLVVTLALGIGANSAIFSVLNGVLFSPLPYGEPDELVTIHHRVGGDGGSAQRGGVSGPDFLDYQRQASSFQGLTTVNSIGTSLTGEGPPERITLSWVSSDFFSVLDVDAALGRTLNADDQVFADRAAITQPGYQPTPVAAVLSHGFWQRAFASDPEVSGQPVRINGQPMTVVGVMPPSFRVHLPADASIPTDIDAWILIPVSLDTFNRGPGGFSVLARLAPGVSLDQAREEMDALSARLRESYPVHARVETRAEVAFLHDEVVGPVRSFLWVLFGAVGFVLLIACANVAGLLLVRASAREREFAVRVALGGGRGRILRQVLTESLLVSVVGTVIGVLMAYWGVDLLLALRPENLPRLENVAVDGTVLGFSALVCVVAAFVFGLAPAVRASGQAPGEALTDRGGVSGGRRKVELRSSLIVAEVALSVVLAMGAGLMLRSFGQLQGVEPGFEPEGAVTATVSLPFFEYRDRAKRLSFYERLVEGVSDVPEVEAVGATVAAPLSGGGWTSAWALEAGDQGAWERNAMGFRPVTPGVFRGLGSRLLAGRGLEPRDHQLDSRPVVVVDEALAERIWPDQDAVGRSFWMPLRGEVGGGERVLVEVVGVVESMRNQDLTLPARGTVYAPSSLYAWFEMTLVVRSELGPGRVGQEIERVMAGVDPSVPVFDVEPLAARVEESMAGLRFALTVLGVFAVVAVVMAMVGLYGVVSTAVLQRTREFGVRMAMGAGGRTILRMVLRQGMVVAGLGLVLGVVGAGALTGALAGLLYEVAALDVITFVATPALLALVTLGACWLPARRATRVDPVLALKSE